MKKRARLSSGAPLIPMAAVPIRRRVARLVSLSFLALLALTGRAWAHTSLLESSPADRSRLSEAPESLRLRFSDPVEPASVTVDVLSVDGRHHEGAVRRTGGPLTDVVEFSLPRLPDGGTYGLTWQSFGPDGHRVAGEVVIGVGYVSEHDVAGASFSSVSIWNRLTELGGVVGRFSWYVGLSLAVGALFGMRWAGRKPADKEPKSVRKGRAAVGGVAGGLLVAGLGVAGAGAGLRWAVGLMVRFGSYGPEASYPGRAWMALDSPPGWLGLLALGLLAWSWRTSAAVSPERRATSPRVLRRVSGALGVAALCLSVGGHALAEDVPLVAVVLAAAHVLAAALWLGPLVLASVFARSEWMRSADPDDRRALLGSYFGAYARVAAFVFAVLVGTGARAMLANVGLHLFENGYGRALAAKLLVVVAVLVPLGWYHDRSVRVRKERLARPGFQSGLRLETAGLAAVLGLASVITILNPEESGRPVGTPAAASGFATGPVDDVGQCSALVVGKRNCYREYFAGLMRKQDAGVAVAEVAALARTDTYLAVECHQVEHDLGNDAAVHYGSIAQALSFEGSACASGYYHGVVEKIMSQYDDDSLRTAIPTVCESVATRRYSTEHFSCIHGIGHGIMLRFDADLWKSMPYCKALAESWEFDSCIGGLFMENVISAQAGHVKGTFKAEDPLFPCSVVADNEKEQCWGIHSSYLLWKHANSYPKAFALCDRAEPRFVGTCYQSMGRDISGAALLDPPKVIAACNLGRPEFRGRCIEGAALNAVYTDHDTAKADVLCREVAPAYQSVCRSARDRVSAAL